jgi:hypothetical protein
MHMAYLALHTWPTIMSSASTPEALLAMLGRNQGSEHLHRLHLVTKKGAMLSKSIF